MPAERAMESDCAIAIVGLGGLFPGADTLEQFWANIRDGLDATSEVPPSRWLIDPAEAFDPRIALADHVYSTRGCFITRPRLEAGEFKLDRNGVEGLEPLFQLALYAALAAWRDARTTDLDRGRVGVVLGNIVLPTETAAASSRELLGGIFEDELHRLRQSREGMPLSK